MVDISRASDPKGNRVNADALPLAPSPPPANANSIRPWHAVLLILAVTVAAYFPILRAGYIWDDSQHVTNNLLLRTPDGLQTLWLVRTALPQYYPLTHTFFWIEFHLWGIHPLGYHAVNLLLHACNAALVWMILRRLAIPGALLAAILFAVHPVNVETVGWISERKNTLSSFFYLLSFLAYLRFEKASHARTNWYLLSLLLFIGSLLSKSVSCTLPAALLLILWWRDGRVRIGTVLSLVPFFAVGLVLGLNTAYLERTRVTASGPEWRFASTIPGEVVARCLIAGRAIWFYLTKLLVPYPLMFEYPRWHIDDSVAWQYAFPIAAILLLVSLFRLRNHIGRGPLTAALFLIGTLFPALGFANLFPMRYSLVADHFQYMAMIGPLALVGAGLTKLSPRSVGKYLPPELLVTGLMALTFVRTFAFQNEATLYADSISKNPNGWLSQSNYGALLAGEGKTDEAIPHLMMGLELHPINPVVADYLGNIAAHKNRYDEAVAWYRRSIAWDPKYGIAHYDLAGLLEGRGDIAGARREYQAAVALSPNHAPAHLNYGVLLGGQGDYADAAIQFGEAVRIDSRSVLARRDLIAALEHGGQLDEAAVQIQHLIEMAPNDALAYNNLGLVETARHHTTAAMAAFSHALTLNPQLGEARQHLDALITRSATQP
jgi:tetratricopeptide (TPR) repeat protein